MAIDPKLIKQLREQTSAGILDVKNALEFSKGDYKKAVDYLEEKGILKANKKVGRIAADGLVLAHTIKNKAIIIELNCETDFVALTKEFKTLLSNITNAILNSNIKSYDEYNKIKVNDEPIDNAIIAATTKIGEKISCRRFEIITKKDSEVFGIYNHTNGKIASIIVLDNCDEQVARNVSMHLSAMNPKYMTEKNISTDQIMKYKKNILDEMKNINKPKQVKEMISMGKLKKILSEIVLLDQEFVMDSKITVQKYIKNKKGKFIAGIRYEVGEGITKEVVDFAKEVKKQIK